MSSNAREIQKCKKCGHVYSEREIIIRGSPQLSMHFKMFETPKLCTRCGGDVVWSSKLDNSFIEPFEPFRFTGFVLRCGVFGIFGYFVGMGIAYLTNNVSLINEISTAGFFIAIPICFVIWIWLKNKFELELEIWNAKLTWHRYLHYKLLHHQAILAGHTVTFRFSSNNRIVKIARVLGVGMKYLGVSVLVREDTADINLRFHEYSATDIYYRISDRQEIPLKEGIVSNESAVAEIINEMVDIFKSAG